MGYHFERLEIYQRAEECLGLVYEVAALLPPLERFNLGEQLRRAALSVVLNIAESTERKGPRDGARFIRIALGSMVEVVSCLRIAQQHYTIPESSLAYLNAQLEILYRKTHAYRNTLTRR